MPDFPSVTNVDVHPHYNFWHQLGSWGLGFVGVAGVIATMTGPPDHLMTQEHWEVLTFACIIISTFAKSIQSKLGSQAAAPPKPNP